MTCFPRVRKGKPMKRSGTIICLAVALCLFFSATALACSYYDTYGDHDWIYGSTKATCETDGEAYRDCAECGLHEVQGIITASHTWTDAGIKKEATCTADGEKLMECSVCHAQKSITLPATGHSYSEWVTVKEATCSEEGQRTSVCTICGQQVYESIARTSHTYGEWEVTLQPTDSSQGRRTRRCTICGASNEEYFYPEGTLYRGMKKDDDVQQMQQMLIDLDILNDKADGIFGKNTEQAVRDYQEQAGLEVTGIAYPQTIADIEKKWEAANGGNASDYYAENGFPEKCIRQTDENGFETVIYCRLHYETCECAAELFDTAYTEKQQLEALDSAYALWQKELNSMYDRWLNSVSEAEVSSVIESRTAFYVYLETQEFVWSAMYEGDEITVKQNMIEMIKNQCVDICGIIEH